MLPSVHPDLLVQLAVLQYIFSSCSQDSGLQASNLVLIHNYNIHSLAASCKDVLLLFQLRNRLLGSKTHVSLDFSITLNTQPDRHTVESQEILLNELDIDTTHRGFFGGCFLVIKWFKYYISNSRE